MPWDTRADLCLIQIEKKRKRAHDETMDKNVTPEEEEDLSGPTGDEVCRIFDWCIALLYLASLCPSMVYTLSPCFCCLLVEPDQPVREKNVAGNARFLPWLLLSN